MSNFNNEKISDFTIYCIHLLKKSWKFTLSFTLISIIFGVFIIRNNEDIGRSYKAKIAIRSYDVSGYLIVELIHGLKEIDKEELASELKLPVSVASGILNFNTLRQIYDNDTYYDHINIEIDINKSKDKERIYNAVINYILNSPIVKMDEKKYKMKQDSKRALIKKIDSEIKSIALLNTKYRELKTFSYRSNADLYNLKLNIENDLFNPKESIVVIKKYPLKPIINGQVSNNNVLLLLISIIGFVIGFLVYRSIPIFKLILSKEK